MATFLGVVSLVLGLGAPYLGEVSVVGGIIPTEIDIGTPVVGGAPGALLYEDVAQNLAALPDVAAGSYLRSGGVGLPPLWSTLTLPNAAVTGDIFVATGANTMGRLADVALGSFLQSGGVGALPVWSSAVAPTTLPIGIPVTGGGADRLLYEDASQNLAASSEYTLHDVAGSLNMRAGGAITFATRLSINGDVNTGNLWQCYFGAKGVLESCNGMSVTNLTIPWHINTSGTEGINFNNGGSATSVSLDVVSLTANRSVPDFQITQGATPTGDIMRALSSALAKQFSFNKDGWLGLGNFTVPSLLSSSGTLASDGLDSVSTAGLNWRTAGGSNAYAAAVENTSNAQRAHGLLVKIARTNGLDAPQTNALALKCPGVNPSVFSNGVFVANQQSTPSGDFYYQVQLDNSLDNFGGFKATGNALGNVLPFRGDIVALHNTTANHTPYRFNYNHAINGSVVADNYTMAEFVKTSTRSAGTFSSTGTVLAVQNSLSGTVTDTTDLMRLTQDSSSTGAILRTFVGATEHSGFDTTGLLSYQAADTSAAATLGGAGALPVLPAGYLNATVAGTGAVRIPYYLP